MCLTEADKFIDTSDAHFTAQLLPATATSAMALAAYRHLLRATRTAFNGDFHLLHAARLQARAGFDKFTDLDPSSDEAAKGIAHAEGVAEVLRHNIVQGKYVEGKNTLSTYESIELCISEYCLQSIELNIHEDIERGDNDTVKNPLGKGGKVKVGGI